LEKQYYVDRNEASLVNSLANKSRKQYEEYKKKLNVMQYYKELKRDINNKVYTIE
jgi:hypothetical protein